jgi:hypothetical protein
MTNGEVEAVLQGHIADASSFLEAQLSPERATATKFYQGQKFGNEQKGRSQVVLTDVRDTVIAMLPSFMRVFFGAEQAVEYRPHGPEDVATAEQATDFVNTVVLQQDNAGFTEFYAWMKDALVRKLGTMKYWWEDRSTWKAYTAERLDVNQFEALANDPDVQLTSVEEVAADGVVYRNVKYKHWRYEGFARLACVPPEEVLISREARSREDALLIAHQTEKTRSELVAMGIDGKVIDEFGGPSSRLRHSQEDIARRGGMVQDTLEADPDAVRHLYIEAYVYLDVDGDGEAELVKCCCIGEGQHLVKDPEPIDERPLAFLCPDPEPHVLIGQSVADRTMDLQRIKSDVLRAKLDSLAAGIFPRRYVMEGEVNMQDLASTAVGADIRTYSPPANAVFVEKQPPEIEALPVLEYLDLVKTQRVGPMPATLDPDALQSTTAKAVNATVTAASDQLELIARIFAETGVKQLFRGLLKLLVEHQPRARMVRLRNQYVAVDPRAWDADMDVQVNVALGGGLVEEKLGVLAATAAKQEAVLQLLGPSNPLVTLGQYRHTLGKMLELKGFKDVSNYWNDIPLDWQPPPQPPQPNPEMVYAQAEMVKAQAGLAKDQADFQVERAKLEQELLDLRAQLAAKGAQLQLDREKMHLEDDRKRDEVEANIALGVAKINAEHATSVTVEQIRADMQRERMETDKTIARMKPNGKGKKVSITTGDGRKTEASVSED